ncbi:MAG: dTDP-4-dehydrorhamnose reductase [Clostridiaceae bacterium]
MKLLIVGANGQLGRELVKQLKSGRCGLGPLPEGYAGAILDCVDINELDITDKQAAMTYVMESRADIIINCAAYTNVDGCESHQDEAYLTNAVGARNLAAASESIGAKLLHISTDYVFEGNQPEAHREYDLPNPISVYGKTKLAGEEYVRQCCSRWYIVRTAWLYGHEGKNFVKTMMRLGREKGMVTVVNDQRGNPTNAEDLAYHILKIAAGEEYGIYHCTGKGECSWYDFACKIMEYARINAKIIPCTSDEYPSPTKRPANSSLDHMMLRLTVGDQMRDWKQALKYFIDNHKE